MNRIEESCQVDSLLTLLRFCFLKDGPVELLPFLYLGSAHHARRHDCLSELRITALLNVSRRDWQCAGGPQRYKRIAVEDNNAADIGSHFQEAIDFIGERSHTHLSHPSCPIDPDQLNVFIFIFSIIF